MEIQKNDLPLHPLRIRNTVRNDKKKGSEKILKNSFKKIWWFKKYDLSLHHFPLKNQRSEQREKPQGQTRQKERNCSL